MNLLLSSQESVKQESPSVPERSERERQLQEFSEFIRSNSTTLPALTTVLTRLDLIVDGQLQQVMETFNDALWESSAA